MRHEPMFDVLEPRKLLSTVVSSPSFAELFEIPDHLNNRLVGVSDNGKYLWFQPAFLLAEGDVTSFGAVVRDGVTASYDDVAELTGASLVDINNNGLALAVDVEVAVPSPNPGAFWRYAEPFLMDIHTGGREYFLRTATVIHGIQPPELDQFVAVAIGNEGTVGLHDRLGNAWMYRAGTLTFLAHGEIIDVNGQGDVLGVSGTDAFVYTRSGSTVMIPDLHLPNAMNDSGTVVGRNTAGDFIIWYVGEETVVPLPDVPLVEGWGGFAALSNNGSVVTSVIRNLPVFGGNVAVLVLDAENPEYAFDLYPGGVHSEPQIGMINGTVTIDASDHGVFYNSWRMWLPLDSIGGTRPAGIGILPLNDAEVLFSSEGPSTLVLRSEFSVIDVSSRMPAYGWGVDTNSGGIVSANEQSLVVPVRRGNSELGLWAVSFDANGILREELVARFDGGAIGTTFLSEDERIHFTALTNGVLKLAYQSVVGAGAGESWVTVDLSADHLTPQGKSTPDFAGPLTAYATPWNGMNIAGLNADGEVEVVWWAPGLDLWTTSNLSELTGAPRLTGTITSLVTDWGGVSIAGADENGEVHVLWWAPGLDDWQVDNLTALTGGPRVQPDSLSAFVTDWGGQTIAAIGEDGVLTAYWWAPGRDGWVSEAVETVDGPVRAPIGRLATADLGTTLSIVGANADGELLRYFWEPGQGELWAEQNLTQLAEL